MSVKSQPSTPLNEPKKPKSQFIFKWDGSQFLTQTKTIFMQIEFKSALKEIVDYFEQYEKYQFKAHLNSSGIRAAEVEVIKDTLTEMVNNEFNEEIKKSMKSIEKLIINPYMLKVERWHYYAKLIQGYNVGMLGKKTMCYDFKIDQFSSDYAKAKKYLATHDIEKQREEVIQIRSQMKIAQRKIADTERNLLENLFVNNPFRPQNFLSLYVDSSQLLFSYLNQVFTQTQSLNTAFKLQLEKVYDAVLQYQVDAINQSIKGQQFGYRIIQNYNFYHARQTDRQKNLQHFNYENQLFKPRYRFEERQIIDSFQIQGSNKKPKSNSCLYQKIQKVSFSKNIKLYDETLQEDQRYKRQLLTKRSPYQDERSYKIPYDKPKMVISNPYFDPFEYNYEPRQLRNIHYLCTKDVKPKRDWRLVFKDKMEDTKEVFKHLYKIQNIFVHNKQKNYQAPWYDRDKHEESIWIFSYQREEQIQKHNKAYKKQYERPKYISTPGKYVEFIYKSPRNAFKKLQETLEKEEESYIRIEKREKFEKQKLAEEKTRLLKYKNLKSNRPYTMYVQKFLKPADDNLKNYCDEEAIFKYGLKIFKKLQDNKQYLKLEQFLFNYIRETLFQENINYELPQKMPLVWNDKATAEQFASKSTIVKLNKQKKEKKMFLMWGTEIVLYEEHRNVKKQRLDKFTIWTFNKPIQGQKVMFQVRRRMKSIIIDSVQTGYWFENSQQLDPHSYRINQIMCKLQLVHRHFFNMHLRPLTENRRVEKGKQIFERIVQSFD